MTATVPGTPPVVLIAEELAPSVLEVLGEDVEIRHVDGADRAALLPALADAAAVMIRSATQIDAEALAAAPNLKVVARAGIGLDNVDVAAATERGVMVVNAPTSNIVSAAEHAVALLLAAARQIPAADASLREGAWKRSKFMGVEVTDKTVGVVGLGRIGVLVAQRLAAFGVTLIAYDPYIQPGRAAQLGVRLVSLEELLRESDFITIHLPKTPETLGLIGAERAGHHQARRHHRQRRPRRAGRRGRAGRRPAAPVRSARPASTSTPRSPPPTARCSGCRTPSSPRTWAPRPPRRRTRPAPPSPARCGWRCRASSCPTR